MTTTLYQKNYQMISKNGFKSLPLSFNRRAIIASATVTREKNAIHGLTEVDITIPRKLIKAHFEKTGEKLSFTAYIVTCLAHVLKDHPVLNSFIKGRKHIILSDVTISVLIEREISGEKVPEPLGIKAAQRKTYSQINKEIKEAKLQQTEKIGSLSGQTWIRFIPSPFLRLFIRFADKSIFMAKKYGKVAVTSVGMYSKDPIWFIPHGTTTVLITVGSINNKVVEIDKQFVSHEHLCLTVSFDHDIVDGAPASRFMNQLTETIKSGNLLQVE
jgi:pyruvate/2-oxoglutarate dehydrogenase complex dihydrolipoamide acyltransferase (E2) component